MRLSKFSDTQKEYIEAAFKLQVWAYDIDRAARSRGYWDQGKAVIYFITVVLITISACYLNTWTGGVDSEKQREKVAIAMNIYMLASAFYLIGMIWSAMYLWRYYFIAYTVIEIILVPLVFCGLSVYWRVVATKLLYEKKGVTVE